MLELTRTDPELIEFNKAANIDVSDAELEEARKEFDQYMVEID